MSTTRRSIGAGDGMLHPVVLAALALLIVNDHVAKRLLPGAVTGKLSDVAGMVFFPVLLWSLWEVARSIAGRVRRGPSASTSVASLTVVRGAVLLTGAVFSAVKVWTPAADLYRVGLAVLQWPARAAVALFESGGPPALAPVRHVMDATDLWALPALLLPLWLGVARARRASSFAGAEPSSAGDVSGRTGASASSDARRP
jgi:hypothetical protein